MQSISEEEIIKHWETIKEMAITLFNRFKKYLRSLLDACKKAIVQNDEQKKKRSLYKLNFIRPKIKHQVLNRKPKHLIKKVIY